MKKIKLCLVLLFVLSFALLVGCSKPIFTVTFDSNGGSDVATVEVAKKETATKPADPTKEGHDFVGWYIGEEEYAFSTPVVENITLTAKWEAKEYTVTFDANGGSAVAALKVKYNEKAAKPADPTKEGYVFLGWYNGETAYTFSESVKSDLTLTAKWEEKEYVVTFDADGGNDVASSVYIYPLNFENKYKVTEYLDKWNNDEKIVIGDKELEKDQSGIYHRCLHVLQEQQVLL